MERTIRDNEDRTKTISVHETVGVDDHVFIWIECEGRPAISIDLMNSRGRRCLSVRADGHGLFSAVVDVQWLDNAGSERPRRFCAECGAKIDLFSSRGHECPDPLPSDQETCTTQSASGGKNGQANKATR